MHCACVFIFTTSSYTCVLRWLNPLFTTGYKRRLEEDDMYEVLPEDRSDRLGQDLQRYWDVEFQKATKEMRKPRLTKAIIQCYWKSYSVLGLFTLIEVSVMSVPSFGNKV
uniref:Uncharacterized protein n=1 Tax=Acanthochromis polyacanthus TaxID=80966 RepID=A0A3Q1EKB6_9TELE